MFSSPIPVWGWDKQDFWGRLMPSPPTPRLRAAAPQHFSCSPQVVKSVQSHQPSVRLYLHYLLGSRRNSVPFFNPALVTVHSGSAHSVLSLQAVEGEERQGFSMPVPWLALSTLPFQIWGFTWILRHLWVKLKYSLQRGRWACVEHQSRWADLGRGVFPHHWSSKIKAHHFTALIHKKQLNEEGSTENCKASLQNSPYTPTMELIFFLIIPIAIPNN